MVGYQVILYARQGLVYGIRNPNISPVFDTKTTAMEYCLTVMADHWFRMQTMSDARIYAFGGLVSAMKIIDDPPRLRAPQAEAIRRDSALAHPRSPAYSGVRKMVSPLVRFGTSTWTYEGWQGQVYLKQYAKTTFARECLGEYCQYLYNGEPLFRTVGNDSTFYRPPSANQLRHYLKQIPEDFEMCFKVWESITIPTFAKQARYGLHAGQPNPRFLDAQLFQDLVLTPYREANFLPHSGPFLFEFQRHGLSVEEFCSKLDSFLSQLPKEFKYAVEIRNAGLLGPVYRKVLEDHGVAHVYNHWSYMPSLAEQHQRMEESFTAPFTVLRLLTPLKMSYEVAKKRAEPYNKIVDELPAMRNDTVRLIQQSTKQGKKAYVLVNNRAEGNAPTTIQRLVDALATR